ncbi:rhombotin-1 isoform X4 [Vulpes lagopus]|uniref:rhombotin-1 isoform X4 n=1 Tax=Vulpes lagopus TaxID=494514 RepID=UPI001BCA40B5|nr:rhombotin-1 isoform X4 [Vulpes lagopus]
MRKVPVPCGGTEGPWETQAALGRGQRGPRTENRARRLRRLRLRPRPRPGQRLHRGSGDPAADGRAPAPPRPCPRGSAAGAARGARSPEPGARAGPAGAARPAGGGGVRAARPSASSAVPGWRRRGAMVLEQEDVRSSLQF